MSVEVDLPNRENNEIHPRNVIEKYAQSVTKPFDLMAAFFILSRYKLKDSFITPNSLHYNVVSGVWSLALIVTFFFSSFHKFFTTELEGYNFVKYFTNILMFAVYLTGNVTTYCINIMQRYNNVLLALRIQNICEVFKENGISLKKYILLNWMYLVALVLVQVTWIFLFDIGFSSVESMDEIFANIFYLIFDINVLYSVRLIQLTIEPLKVWVADAQKSVIIVEPENEIYWNRKYSLYMKIVEVYETVGNNYQLLMLYYCFGTFINGVISIYLRIELAKIVDGDFIKTAVSTISLLWMVRNISLISSLCLVCEQFYTMLIEVQSSCIQLTTTERCSEFQKRVCKNIQRHAASLQKMTACGLFVIDAGLPLQLFGLLTTYFIVVLQFEFL